MRRYLPVTVYFTVAIVVASLLAWGLSSFLAYPFAKIFSRSLLLMMAIGLIPLVRALGFDATAIGLRPLDARIAWRCWCFAVISIIPVLVFFVWVGFRVFDVRVDLESWGFVGLVAGAIVSSLLVAVFEEALFRGVFFASLKRRSGLPLAVVVTSVVYSLVHFVEKSPVADGEISWFSGLAITAKAFVPLASPGEYWDSFVSLFLLGVAFCYARERFGLWACIGLHAGWVFVIKMFKVLTVRDVVNHYVYLVGDYDNFVGHLVSGWLFAGLLVIFVFHRYRASRTTSD